MRILSLLIISLFMIFMNQKTDSPHGTGFKVSCKTCHSSKGWSLDKAVYSFDHNKTSMKLTGQHTRIDCRQCHVSLVFAEAKNNCSDCHNDVHEGTTGLDCSRCHTSESWLVTNINRVHDLSRFPLLGAHKTADCSQCHKSDNPVRFDVPGIECINCHYDDYASAKNPDHVASGISKDCTSCHKMNAFQWGGAGYNHDFFPLLQGHSTVSCSQCHTNGGFKGLSADCVSCHQADYNGTKNPDHVASKFSSVCTSCHTLSPGWKPANFDHSKFPLKQGHAGPACADCHKNGNYTSTAADCYSCHSADYNSTKNPNHGTSGYSKLCETCHTLTSGWKPATFDHSKFPLTLGHSVPVCTDCHTGGNYTTTPIDCYACHVTDYNTSKNPDHIAAAFAKTCKTCHTTNPGWKPATFDHTKFPLTLGHSGVACSVCHTGGNYATTTTDCYTCHVTDFNSAKNPDHVASGFVKTCLTCHTTNPGWKPATFNHSKFPLTLGHAGVNCIDCHKGGNYAIIPADCYSCHKTDYDNTTNPGHAKLTFATACTQCHTTIPGWKPATYTLHDTQSFKIYSGKHKGTWASCTDCHTNPAAYASYSCITCHEHNQTDMDSKHRGQTGYSYSSTACFNCHPRV